MRNAAALLCVSLYLATTLLWARDSGPITITMTPDRWTKVMGGVDFVDHQGKRCIELKPGDYKNAIPEGVAQLKDVQFHNGTIEYDVAAENGMGASFMFRSAGKDTFEAFYLRPRANCQTAPDCVQYAPQTHGVLLWDLFPQYQGPAPFHSGQWNHVKLVISGKRMNIYVNGETEPNLKIGYLEGDTEQGGVMLAGPGFFADFTIRPDAVDAPADPEPDPTSSDDRYVRHWQISPFSKLTANDAPAYAGLSSVGGWVSLQAERGGLVNISRIYGLALPRPDRAVVWLKTKIRSNITQQKHVSFGWVREASVFVNGQLVYADKNLFQPPEARKPPDGRLSLENGSFMLPLKAGDNEVAVAVVNNFYGWGIKMRFDDVKGVLLDQQ